ncbi:hypothetical protein ACHQM5_018332 [Ranunculus cassubicifolius]
MAALNKILIIGGTGYIGKIMVNASLQAGYPTFALVRESSAADPVKGKLIQSLKDSGVTLLFGDLYDHESLVKAMKQVDIVISTVGNHQLPDQVKIIAAIKEAGNVKRFFPSEFGNDVDRTHAVEPMRSAFDVKSKIRQALKDEEIPHTIVSANWFFGIFLDNLCQTGSTTPPTDKVVILGDGNVKAIFNKENDIGAFTMKTVDDPRTLNKILYIRTQHNTYTFNELVSLWESKIGKTLEKIYLSEEEVLKQIQENNGNRVSIELSIKHSVFIMGDQTNFEIEPSFGMEATQLYPEVKYTTVDEYLNKFI